MMVQITKAFYDADEDPESAITVLTGMFPKIFRVCGVLLIVLKVQIFKNR